MLPDPFPRIVSGCVAVASHEVGTRIDARAIRCSSCHQGCVAEVSQTVSHDGVPVLKGTAMEAKEGAMLALVHVEGTLLSRVLRDKDILIEKLVRALR